MTNSQAQAYAIIALSRLIGSGYIKIAGAEKKHICKILDREMYDLMDILDEDEAEEKAIRILKGMTI